MAIIPIENFYQPSELQMVKIILFIISMQGTWKEQLRNKFKNKRRREKRSIDDVAADDGQDTVLSGISTSPSKR